MRESRVVGYSSRRLSRHETHRMASKGLGPRRGCQCSYISDISVVLFFTEGNHPHRALRHNLVQQNETIIAHR